MLVKHGLPTSNLFEYAALTILKYEKIWFTKKEVAEKEEMEGSQKSQPEIK